MARTRKAPAAGAGTDMVGEVATLLHARQRWEREHFRSRVRQAMLAPWRGSSASTLDTIIAAMAAAAIEDRDVRAAAWLRDTAGEAPRLVVDSSAGDAAAELIERMRAAIARARAREVPLLSAPTGEDEDDGNYGR